MSIFTLQANLAGAGNWEDYTLSIDIPVEIVGSRQIYVNIIGLQHNQILAFTLKQAAIGNKSPPVATRLGTLDAGGRQ